MDTKGVDFRTDKRFDRRVREQKTPEAMIEMYCRAHRWQASLCRVIDARCPAPLLPKA